jgi:hypothetical protein
MRSDQRAATPARRIGRVFAATLVVSALLTTAVGGSGASPRSKLNAAKGRLAALTDRIGSEEEQARVLEDRRSALDERIRAATSRVRGIDAELASTGLELDRAAAAAQRLQTRLNAIARSLFMQGVDSVQASLLGQLLGSSSIADLSDVLAYGQAAGQSEADLAQRVANLRVELRDKAAELQRLRSRQEHLVGELSVERSSEAQAIVAQGAVLSELETTKSRIVGLIATLHREVRAQALAAAGTAFQGPGHVSYGSWAGLFLGRMGAARCRSNLVVVVAWQYSEFTQATWNPLADTLPMPGSTGFNFAGVQNYVSLDQGLIATRTTLVNGGSYGYGTITSDLAACSDPMTTARAINASAWCRGCAGGSYVVDNIAKVEANYDLYAHL